MKLALPCDRILLVVHPDLLLRILHNYVSCRLLLIPGFGPTSTHREARSPKCAPWLHPSAARTLRASTSIPVWPAVNYQATAQSGPGCYPAADIESAEL